MLTIYIVGEDEKIDRLALAESDIAIRTIGGQVDGEHVAVWKTEVLKHRDFQTAIARGRLVRNL